MLDGLDVLVIRGNPRDVEQVTQILQQIEQLSTQTEPSIELYPVLHVDGESLAFLVNQLYSQVYSTRQGSVTITALIKPNMLLLVGRAENVRTRARPDQAARSAGGPGNPVPGVPLEARSVVTAQETVQDFFTSRGGLSTRARVTADFRSNSLVVQASPGDVTDVAALINKLDTPTSDAVNELRVFGLEHSLATDVYNTLEYAIGGQMAAGARPGMRRAGSAARRRGRHGRDDDEIVDAAVRHGRHQGAEDPQLGDPHRRADHARHPLNSILGFRPRRQHGLDRCPDRELDQRPAATAAIKVFTIVNADVGDMVNMLNAVFGQQRRHATRDRPGWRRRRGRKLDHPRPLRLRRPHQQHHRLRARKATWRSSKRFCCGSTRPTRGSAKPRSTA